MRYNFRPSFHFVSSVVGFFFCFRQITENTLITVEYGILKMAIGNRLVLFNKIHSLPKNPILGTHYQCSLPDSLILFLQTTKRVCPPNCLSPSLYNQRVNAQRIDPRRAGTNSTFSILKPCRVNS